jgi:hypothetical protein
MHMRVSNQLAPFGFGRGYRGLVELHLLSGVFKRGGHEDDGGWELLPVT